MKTGEPQGLSLEELSTQVEQLLSRYALLGAQKDQRVSPVPDARTIRYYTTLGLLDRPRLDGRQARYARRHVLQLLAIKALQSANLPLVEIQSRLYGRSDAELEAILASLADAQGRAQLEEPVKSVVWREVVIEPGVRLLVQDGWEPQQDKEATVKKLRAALEALSFDRGFDGGFSDGNRP